jgi:hypothetical protein
MVLTKKNTIYCVSTLYFFMNLKCILKIKISSRSSVVGPFVIYGRPLFRVSGDATHGDEITRKIERTNTIMAARMRNVIVVHSIT